MTKRLFDTNVMQQCCTATVTACFPRKKGYGILLDQTVFFPESGGQLSDTGVLRTGETTWRVTHAAESDGDVIHEVDSPIPEGTQVEAVLDWTVRMDHMQQHCGEHLVSYAFWKLYGAHNIGFHMNPELVTIDFDKELSWEQAMEAERLANQHIEDNRPVTIQMATPEEAAKMHLRKFNDKITGPVRIVCVEGSDTCSCCGTHPPMTGMIGLVKIFKVERHRGGTRLTMLCGRLAMERIRHEMEAATQASNLLSVKEDDLPAGVTRLQEEIATLKQHLNERTEQLLAYRIEDIQKHPVYDAQGNQRITLFEDDMDAGEAKFLMKRLQELPKTIATLLYRHGDRLNYIVEVADDADADASAILRELNTRFGGKGGGKSHNAQGSAPYTDETKRRAKDYVQSGNE